MTYQDDLRTQISNAEALDYKELGLEPSKTVNTWDHIVKGLAIAVLVVVTFTVIIWMM